MEAEKTFVYVGRWDLLPEEWEGINGLYEKTRDEIRNEVGRQMDIALDNDLEGGDFIGGYSLEEFEDTFNQCLTEFISSNVYWIKFF